MRACIYLDFLNFGDIGLSAEFGRVEALMGRVYRRISYYGSTLIDLFRARLVCLVSFSDGDLLRFGHLHP